MRLISLTKRPHERLLRFSRRDLAALRRWLGATARAELGAATPTVEPVVRMPAAERREAARRPFQTLAELRPISAGGIALVRTAAVCDVSSEGIALRASEPLPAGQRISLDIHPPYNLPRRRFGRADRSIQLLAVVRYCRPEGAGFILGCSIGVDWADSLANQMFPADLPALRKTA